ncbi:MAG: hypothetical protein NC181_05485 [Clostridium sp.]|nr:hypothetical protein [Clostridium sp.]MCM1444689.1 hypothetical protein [Candidatus Amulumruptor caecigallinarius]
MRNKGYVIFKNKTKLNVIFDNNNTGFNIKPLNKINYPGIKVNSMVIVNPNFIQTVLKRKIKRKLDSFLRLMIKVLEDEDNDSSDVIKALNEIARYKSIIINKYQKYLDEKYMKLLLKKIDFLEEELKQKIIFMNDYEYEDDMTRRRSR